MQNNRIPLIAAWLICVVLLVLVLFLHLLPALLAGLLVYELVHLLALRLPGKLCGGRARLVAVALVAVLVVSAVGLGIFALVAFFHSDAGSLPELFKKMAEIIERSRDVLPAIVMENFPVDAEGIQTAVVQFLREHAGALGLAGKEAGRAIAYALIGMVVGAMLALHDSVRAPDPQPLATALTERAARLAEAFRRVVFAQVRIAALNTVFTGIYLAIVLPLLDIHLPLGKSLIALTFFAGLIPVLGNLLSNAAIVVVSLAYSPVVAISSLIFLVVIHKLEYFLNARIIGGSIRAYSWELLLAMLLMEAAFGLPGVIAAPIYYAYLKDELMARGWV